MTDENLFAPDYREEPYWWTAAPQPVESPTPLSGKTDVAIVGSGFTGLSAALTLARAGRSVQVLEADVPGYGASSRNAGFVGKTLKHSFASLLANHGEDYAVRVYREMQAAFDCVTGLIEREQIQCHYNVCGRYMAAHSPAQYEAMARDLELKRKHLGDHGEMVPRDEQHREIGSDRYHGGAVIPALGSVHPGLYHLGLLETARAAGASVLGQTRVLSILRDGDDFRVITDRGVVHAHDIVVATNGYTGTATPWLQQRTIAFSAYMVATEELSEKTLERAFPNARTVHDYNHNLVYMRRAPDSPRLLIGAKTGSRCNDLRSKAAELHAVLCGIFPDMEDARISRVWTGNCAATFDMYPHLGVHDGVHYALGYCFAGVPMGTYLGEKVALRILDKPQAGTVFADREFPTRIWYGGNPWFVPWAMKWYDWQDARNAA